MSSTPEGTRAYHLRKALNTAPWLFIFTMALVFVKSASAQAVITYSGASVGANGTIYGWGVTDATNYGMYHTAYATTTLRSPNGRTATAYQMQGDPWVQANVSLPWASNDLGYYTVDTTHDYYCYWLPAMIAAGQTSGGSTAPYVLLLLVSTAITIPTDNAGRTAFNADLGSTNLGTRYYPTPPYWGTGVQIIGTVYPTNFSGAITIRREVLEDKIYEGNTLYQVAAPPIYDDTSFSQHRDDSPQSGGSAGKVYDLDAPGIGGFPLGTTHRYRTNFRQWAVLNSSGAVVSPSYLYWYSRLSIYRDSAGEHLKTDVSGDNVAATGQTNTTWNLQ